MADLRRERARAQDVETGAAGADRGRAAERPAEIPRRGWKDILVRLRRDMRDDNVSLLAAGVAFYALLALVPALVALVSAYGLVADPADIERNVDDALAAAPAEVRDLVRSQLSSIVDSSPSGLRLGAIVGLAVALWSASSGMKNLVTAITLAYDERETRGFVRLRGLSLVLTVGAVVWGALALMVLVILPNRLSDSGATGVIRSLAMIVRWPVAAVLVMAALAVLYRYAADRDRPRWNWASPGAVVATVVWVAASIGFSIYTANFGRYNETYGALGAVIVVMLWLAISAYVVIAGAELNGQIEHQTAVDTTTGRPRPMGERDAYVADTLGPSTEREST
jgi:membrane protein